MSKKPQLLKAQSGLKHLNRGSFPKYSILKTALVNWIKEKRKNQNTVLRIIIQMKGKALA